VAAADPPEHDEVRRQDPHRGPVDGVPDVVARERGERTDDQEQRERAVERGAPDDRPSRHGGGHAERDQAADGDLHPARRHGEAQREQPQQPIGHTADRGRRVPVRGDAHTPRRVRITLKVSERILRSSQSEWLWIYERSYLSLVDGEVWYSPF